MRYINHDLLYDWCREVIPALLISGFLKLELVKPDTKRLKIKIATKMQFIVSA